VRDRFPSRQAFAATLERSGIDENHVREIVRQDLRAVAYLNQRFATDGRRAARAADQRLDGGSPSARGRHRLVPHAVNAKDTLFRAVAP